MYLIYHMGVFSCSRRNKGCNVVNFCMPVSHWLNGGIMGAQFVVCYMVGPPMARKKVYLILHCKLSVTRKEVAHVINLKNTHPGCMKWKVNVCTLQEDCIVKNWCFVSALSHCQSRFQSNISNFHNFFSFYLAIVFFFSHLVGQPSILTPLYSSIKLQCNATRTLPN